MTLFQIARWYLALMVVCSLSCNSFHRNQSHRAVREESIARGQQLAQVYCASCHQLPNPSLLDAKSWEEGVLPHMGPRLGIYEFKFRRYPAEIADRNLPPGYYPAHAAVTEDEWQQIIDYYTATSPDSLMPAGGVPAAVRVSPLFTAQLPDTPYGGSAISFVQIDAGKHQLMTADLLHQNLVRYDAGLKPVDSLPLFGRIVNGQLQQNRLLACNIGIFSPTNERYGKAQEVVFDPAGRMQAVEKPLLGQLQRPVEITAADLDRDGKADLLACEFGYLAGSLSWYSDPGTQQAQKHVLRAQPGALRTLITDYNRDGLPDVWALFAQGEEGVFLFTNRGGGRFEPQQVLRFPPSYGSSGFELADFDGDGYADIIYTCGDNADYSTIFKPYHGVYIFLNDGRNHFRQQFFYPINGCYKALARDFDGDGDLDLACIAYFADFVHRPDEGFTYLENNGNFHFTPFSVQGTRTGRWMTMDAGDLDGDGRIDLVLGNFSVGPVMLTSHADWEKGPPFLVLKNVGKM